MIRTYARKPPECRYIEGVLGMCRLCLQRAEETIPIFTEDRTEICSSLALRIMICVGLELKREDTLPNHICQACYKDLEQYYAFRKKCEVSYQKLKLHIQAIQNRQAAEALTSASEQAIKQIDEECQDQGEHVNVEELEMMMESEENYGITEIEAASVMNDVQSIYPVTAEESNIKVTTEPVELPVLIEAVLVKLGVLSRAGPFLACRGQPARVQLETADDAAVRMEVVEEDDASETGIVEQLEDIDVGDMMNPADATFCGTTTSPVDSGPVKLPVLIEAVLVRLGDLGVHSRAGPFLACREQPARVQLETADDAAVRMEVVEEDDASETGMVEQDQDGPYQDVQETKAAFCLDPVKQNEVQRISANGLVKIKIHDEVKPKKATRRSKAVGSTECPRCGRVLASVSALRRHARTHSGERPYACAVCARTFAQKEVMLRHRLVHEDVRPHQCTKCPKSFTQRNALTVHERSHLPPHERALPLHSCPYCPKVFLYSSGLSRHMMMHSGRLYECGACHRQFADKSSVLRHVRRAKHVPATATATADTDSATEQSEQ